MELQTSIYKICSSILFEFVDLVLIWQISNNITNMILFLFFFNCLNIYSIFAVLEILVVV